MGFPRAKRWLYDSGCRMPMIAHLPERFRPAGQAEPNTVEERMISFLDLGPTVLNLAGLPVPEHMHGQPFLGPDLPPPRQFIFAARDRMDERYDTIRSVRDSRFRYVRNFEPFRPYYQRVEYGEVTGMMQDLRRLHAEGKLPPVADQYLADHKPLEELYDTDADPHEVHNLADSPAHEPELLRLRQMLRDWMVETEDVALIPEAEVVELEKRYGNRHAILRAPENRDLQQRLFFVVEAGEAGRLPQLREALSAPEPSVRYWAALWIGLQKAGAAVNELLPLLADASAVVRVAAATALCRIGRATEGLPVLTALLTHENEYVRLRAATELDYLEDLALPALDAFRQIAGNDPSGDMQKLARRVIAELEPLR
ncbi:MAG: hypothetical protein FJX74_11995 [Armatimonadetes bacterium]|nr:hypothetical protein [Armatimonadota bacterium]